MSRSSRPAITTSTTSPAKSLFSPHYLNNRLRDHDEWREDVSAPLDELRTLYEKTKTILPTSNEAQTEEEFVRPALKVLGFAFIPQTLTRVGGRPQRPD